MSLEHVGVPVEGFVYLTRFLAESPPGTDWRGEVARALVHRLGVALVAFLEREDGIWVVRSAHAADPELGRLVHRGMGLAASGHEAGGALCGAVEEVACEALGTGQAASREVTDPAAMTLVGVPIRSEGVGRAVMVVGHRVPVPLFDTWVDAYRAIAAQVALRLGVGRERVTDEASHPSTWAIAEWDATFDAMDDVVWLLDANHRVIRANVATRAVFGLEPAQCIGRLCWELAHGTAGPHVRCPVRRMRGTHRREIEEFRLNRRWVRVTADPLFDEGGRYAGAVHVVVDRTEWKRKEEALRECERHLSAVQRLARVGSWVWQAGWRHVECSEEMARLWGFPRGTTRARRRAIMERIHPEDRLRVRAAIARAVGDRDRADVVCRLLLPDGVERFLSGVIYAEWDGDGQPVLVRGIAQDITTQKRGEERLRKRVAYEQLLARVSALALESDTFDTFLETCLQLMGTTIGASRAYLFEHRHGLETMDNTFEWVAPGVPSEKDNLQGIPAGAFPWWMERLRNFEVIRYSDVREMPSEAVREILEKQGVMSILVVPLVVDREYYGFIGFDSCGVRREWAEEDVGVLMSAARIIATAVERHRAREALRRSEENYRSLAETTRDVILVHDMNGVLTYINQAGLELTGHNLQDVLGQPISLFVPPEYDKDIRERWVALTHGTVQPTVYEAEILSRNRERIPVEISSTPIRSSEGKEGVLVVARDITERKRAAAEREHLQAQLHQARKMESIGRLAGGIAHDFNNMLAVIIGHADLVLMETPSGDPHRQDLEEILRAANRSAELTRQLLGFARKQLIAPRVLDMNRTIEGMLQMLRRLIGEHIELVWVPAPDLWQVLVDPSQVDQILVNLCVNARDAIGETGTITIETSNVVVDGAYCAAHAGFVPGEFAVLSVTDDGCGIEACHLDKVFEPFFTTKGMGQSTGMGLATVYGIVKQNRGHINVYSEPGHGTTFRVYLPRHQGRVFEPTTRDPRRIPPGRGESILLVEDEPGVLSMTSLMLERLGYSVVAVNRPSEAVEVARTRAGELDLLMTDVIMPEMSGKDLARRVQASCPGIGVLYASGYTATTVAGKGVLGEGGDFIQKPFSTEELACKVRKALDKAREKRGDRSGPPDPSESL